MKFDNEATRAISIIAERMGVTFDDVIKGRSKKACAARYMACTYLHCDLDLSGYELSRQIGQTRVNILRGIRTLKGWMKYHSDIRDRYVDIKQEIEEANTASSIHI